MIGLLDGYRTLSGGGIGQWSGPRYEDLERSRFWQHMDMLFVLA